MVQAATEAQENNETILVIVTTILQILAGMAGFKEDPLYTSLQVILYSLSPQKKALLFFMYKVQPVSTQH